MIDILEGKYVFVVLGLPLSVIIWHKKYTYTVFSHPGNSMLWALVLLVGIPFLEALDPTLNAEWQAFQIKYERDYSLAEELYRRQIWEGNHQLIQEHNSQPGNTYTMEVNR